MDSKDEAITLDFLAETMNLGLGHVIDELSETTGSRIELHIPEMNMVPKAEVIEESAVLNAHQERIVVVRQKYKGDLEGEAILLFDERESMQLLKDVLNQRSSKTDSFAAAEKEVLLDISNVAVTGVVYALSSMLELSISSDLPSCEFGTMNDIQRESDVFDDRDDMILYLSICLTLVDKNSDVKLMLFQRRETLQKLFEILKNKISLE